jgi:mannosyltransferase OCH1-like enzyme
MKSKIFFFIQCALLSSFCFSTIESKETKIYHDRTFREMMGLCSYGINPNTMSKRDDRDIKKLEKLFFKNIVHMNNPMRRNAIPKVVHFIWVGPKSFPEESVKNILSWRKYHPDWKFKFWTDSAERPCPIPDMEKILVQDYDFDEVEKYMEQTTNWGEKSDLMRFVIIYREGGFYADHDAECLRSFEPLLKFDFVACCERSHYHKGLDTCVVPANGLFAASPAHPILAECLYNVRKKWKELEKLHPNSEGPTPWWKVIRRTFDSFAKASKEYSDMPGKVDLILPTCFFYPNRILPPTIIEDFKTADLTWSSHGYAASWKKGM